MKWQSWSSRPATKAMKQSPTSCECFWASDCTKQLVDFMMMLFVGPTTCLDVTRMTRLDWTKQLLHYRRQMWFGTSSKSAQALKHHTREEMGEHLLSRRMRALSRMSKVCMICKGWISFQLHPRRLQEHESCRMQTAAAAAATALSPDSLCHSSYIDA